MASTSPPPCNEISIHLGPPSDPRTFKKPIFLLGKRCTLPVNIPDAASDSDGEDAKIGPSMLLRSDSLAGNVLVKVDSDGNMDCKAYWIQRKLAKTTYGSVRVGYVLRPRVDADESGGSSEDETENDEAPSGRKRLRKSIQWEVSPLKSGRGYEMVAIKMSDKKKIESQRGRRSDDPIVELCAMQMTDADEAEANHVLGSLETIEDERFIYNIMPYSADGDLFHFIKRTGRLEEEVARHFFRQILKALKHFQRIGLCHRDLCLENLLLRGTDCFVTGFSKCLLIPYVTSETKDTTGNTSGSIRCLITPQGQCGRPHSMAPEILDNKESFDGHAIDLWAAGIMLFHMIVGDRPFVWAVEDDPRFKLISVKCELRSLFQKLECEGVVKQGGLSSDVMDLLQKMLKANPQDRLSLNDVMSHYWVSNGEEKLPDLAPKKIFVAT